VPVTANDASIALQDFATLLKAASPSPAANPYEAEKSLIESTGAIPLFHLPRAWMLSSRVKNWPRFEEVWLDAGAAQ
jgi:hypothetical protein